MIRTIHLILITACLQFWAAGHSAADVIFFDDFDSGASALWGNEQGAWTDAGGVYSATVPDNVPNAHSSLPFLLTDFSVDVDINNIQDGGIWLRSAAAPGTPIGRKGVVLVTGVLGGLYWHDVVDGNNYGSALNITGGLFTSGVSDPHLRIEVSGNSYAAFVDGSSVAATSLTSTNHASGQVALYDFSGQTFDNVLVVPEPAAAGLLGIGFLLSIGSRRRKRV